MTEPLKVDTDELDAASAILKSAAGQIPTQLPQFSVNGSDPLSAAIRAGSAQMEAPMAALPWIKAEATTTAEKIGVAGQRYRETDETLAQKAKEQQFDKDDADAARGTQGGGIGKYKASPQFGKDAPPLSPADPSLTPTPAPTPSSDTGSPVAIDEQDLEAIGKQGDVLEKSSEEARKHAAGRTAETFEHTQGFGKLLGRLSVVGELWSGTKEFAADLEQGKSLKDAVIDVVPKTLLAISGSWGGTAFGAAGGALAALGKDLPEVPFLDGSGNALVGIAGAGTGALILGDVGGEAGKAAGEAISDVLREALD